jgi:hypothetical protein
MRPGPSLPAGHQTPALPPGASAPGSGMPTHTAPPPHLSTAPMHPGSTRHSSSPGPGVTRPLGAPPPRPGFAARPAIAGTNAMGNQPSPSPLPTAPFSGVTVATNSRQSTPGPPSAGPNNGSVSGPPSGTGLSLPLRPQLATPGIRPPLFGPRPGIGMAPPMRPAPPGTQQANFPAPSSAQMSAGQPPPGGAAPGAPPIPGRPLPQPSAPPPPAAQTDFASGAPPLVHPVAAVKASGPHASATVPNFSRRHAAPTGPQPPIAPVSDPTSLHNATYSKSPSRRRSPRRGTRSPRSPRSPQGTSPRVDSRKLPRYPLDFQIEPETFTTRTAPIGSQQDTLHQIPRRADSEFVSSDFGSCLPHFMRVTTNNFPKNKDDLVRPFPHFPVACLPPALHFFPLTFLSLAALKLCPGLGHV